jgi:hypothetical protein
MVYNKERYNSEICNPPLSGWADLVEKNISILQPFFSGNLREKLISEAYKFTNSLEGVPQIKAKTNASRIIMTGHQPEIYHHGLLYKNEVLENFCSQNNVTGINLIVDLDEGSPGAIVYPTRLGGIPAKKRIEFPGNTAPYINLNIPDKNAVEKVFSEVGNSPQIKKYRDLYISQCGKPVIKAHASIRRIYQNAEFYLEIPLSYVLRFQEVKDFFYNILRNYKTFAESYNCKLQEFRKSENIKNKANPFPDLKIEAEKMEMPFWLFKNSDESRESLFLENNFEEVISNCESGQYILAPKAALITVLARLLLSELFIHGLGGSKYDRFTNQLIKDYFKTEAPAFVTASANKYFFENEIREYEEAKSRAEERRKLNFHIDKYLNGLNWDAGVKERLRDLTKEKAANIEKIKRGKIERISTAGYTQDIKRIESEIRSVLEGQLGPAEAFQEPSKIYLETIYSRDFSFFVVE